MAIGEFDLVGFDVGVIYLGVGVIYKLFAEWALEIAEYYDGYFGIIRSKCRQMAYRYIRFGRRLCWGLRSGIRIAQDIICLAG